MLETTERAAYTLTKSVKSQLEEAVPKTKRSKFVNEAIASALLAQAKAKALKALESAPLIKNETGQDCVEVLREMRAKRTKEIIERHEPLNS